MSELDLRSGRVRSMCRFPGVRYNNAGLIDFRVSIMPTVHGEMPCCCAYWTKSR